MNETRLQETIISLNHHQFFWANWPIYRIRFFMQDFLWFTFFEFILLNPTHSFVWFRILELGLISRVLLLTCPKFWFPYSPFFIWISYRNKLYESVIINFSSTILRIYFINKTTQKYQKSISIVPASSKTCVIRQWLLNQHKHKKAKRIQN